MKQKLENKLIKFFEDRPIIEYRKGEIIFRPGEPISHVAFIKSGYVRLYKITKDGSEITINLFKPVFPLSFLYAATKRDCDYYLEAITDVYLWKSDMEEFDKYLIKNPEIMEDLLMYQMGKFETLLSNVEHVMGGYAQNKIASIIGSVVERHGVEVDGDLEIAFDTTHRIISSLCGLTRETTSREIKKLENKGVIKQREGKIVITNIEELDQIAQS